jgi:hypothetical protein
MYKSRILILQCPKREREYGFRKIKLFILLGGSATKLKYSALKVLRECPIGLFVNVRWRKVKRFRKGRREK